MFSQEQWLNKKSKWDMSLYRISKMPSMLRHISNSVIVSPKGWGVGDTTQSYKCSH